jgi:6-phosphogluconolactonase (cycloisomerase 2 family)
LKNLHSRFSRWFPTLETNGFHVSPRRLATLRRRCRNPAGVAAIALTTLAFAACGGNDNSSGPTATYTVGGTLTGLASGQSLTLADNNTDALTVVGNGTFTFKTPVAQSGAYSVTITAQPAGQTCTVGSGSGTVSADVTSVAVACKNTLYTVGGTVTGLNPGASITLQDNGADTLTVTHDGTFTFAASLAYNATYTVTTTTQPVAHGQVCTVTNGFSVVTGNVTTVAVTCGPANQYAYVVNFGAVAAGASAGTVSQFLVGSGGSLTALSSGSVTTGSSANTPTAIAVSPNYSCVYVTNYTDGTVSQYSIAPGGVLTPLASVAGTVPYFTGIVSTGSTATPGPAAIAVDPNGKYVYVLNATEATITEFSIGTMGELTPLTTTLAASTLPTSTQLPTSTPPTVITPGGQPPVLAGQIAVDPAGRFLFVTSPVSNTVTQYSIDAATGALTVSPAAPLMTGTTPIGIAINPASSDLYVANSGDSRGDLSQFSLSSTGLAPLTPPTVMTFGANPSFVAIDPTGKYLYESDNYAGMAGTISQYTIGTTGALTLMRVNSVGAGSSPQWITVDLTGQYVYVINTFDGTVGQYMITPANSTTSGAIPGALTMLTAGPVTGNGLSTPTAIAVAYGQ